MRGITETVKHLIIINAIMFIGTLTIGQGELFYRWFALYYPENDLFYPWQIITHMFMHGGVMHLFFNMFALYMFGVAVEQVFGSRKFIFFYISSGLGAVVLTYLVYYIQIGGYLMDISKLGLPSELINAVFNLDIISGNRFEGRLLYEQVEPLFASYNQEISLVNGPVFDAFFNINVLSRGTMVGASGALMGVLVAFGMIYPESRLMLLFLPVPIKAKYFIPGIIILDIISAVTGQSFFSPSNTAYVAHIGGALTGFIMMWYWKKNQFNNKRWN